jgi:hypothetical protein
MLDTDIVFFESESQRPDDTFGGQITSRVITSGQVGNLVPPIADADKVSGYVAGYKFYVSAYTDGIEVYYKPWAFIAKPPADAEVAVCLLYTASAYDRWAEARAKLEQYLVISGKWYGKLYGLQLANQKAIQIYQPTGGDLPGVGETYALTKSYGTPSAHVQLVRSTEVAVQTRTVYIGGNAHTFDFITIQLAERLDEDYDGGAVTLEDSPTGVAEFRTTRVADAVTLYSVKALQAEALALANTVQVGSIYHRLIPSAETSVNLPNMDIGGKSQGLIASGSGSYSFATSASVAPGEALYLGTPFLPGTLTVSGLTDNGRGSLLSGSTVVANLNYVNGIVTGVAGAPTYSGSKSFTLQTAGSPLQYMHSASIGVDAASRRENYVLTLGWVPSPGSLSVSYIAGGKVYKIWDRGIGILQGIDSSHGVGQFRWDTNTLEFTLVYLADAGTEIVIASGSASVTANHAGETLPAPEFRFQLANAGGVPGSFTLIWNDGSARSATDNSKGLLTGDAAGSVRYLASGGPLLTVRPTTLPAAGTLFTVTYDQGAPLSHTVDNPNVGGDGFVTIELDVTGLHPGSVEVQYQAGDKTYLAQDDGLGHFHDRPNTEWIDYAAGQVKIHPDQSVYKPIASFSLVETGVLTHDQRVAMGKDTAGSSTASSREISTKTSISSSVTIDVLAGGITVRYRLTGTGSAQLEYHTADTLYMDITPDLNQPLVPSTALFTLAGRTYQDNAGRLLTDIDHATGAGTDAGTLDGATGLATLSIWNAGTPTRSLYACLTAMGRVQVSDCVFMSPSRPLSPGSVQILATTVAGAAVNVTVPTSGILAATHVSGIVNANTGIFHLRFGDWHTLVTGDDAQWWYDAANIRESDGKIWKPGPIFADTLRVNATAVSYLPVDKAEIGINPSAFPGNGLAQCYAKADDAVVHHEDALALENPITQGAVYLAGRNRLYRVRVTDANGLNVPASASTWTEHKTNENGLLGVQFAYSANLNLSAYVQPLTLHHQILDRMRVLDVDLSGLITFERPLSHDYPAGAYVSKALPLGNMLVSVPVAFTQATWTSVWSDTRIGNEPIMQYQSALFPIELVNDGAVTDSWVMVMASTTNYNCYSEGLGKVNATPVSINTDYSPGNPLTGKAYFTVRAGFLGQGGNIGECFRFDTVGANRGVWPIVTVLPGSSLTSNDQFQVQVIGNASA